MKLNFIYLYLIAMLFISFGCLKQKASDPKVSGVKMQNINPGVFLASHYQSTCWESWGLDRWKQEIRAMKKMGAKTIWYLPIQFGQHESANDFAEGAAFRELQKSISSFIKAEGMEVGIYVGYNDIFPETIRKHPEWAATYGKYGMEQGQACPSNAEALKEILSLREKLFRDLPCVDYLMCPITDYGGCGCEKCAPLPKTYLDVFQKMAQSCKQFHPGVKIVASGCGVNEEDIEAIRKLLYGADWVDFVSDLPRGVKPVIKYYMSPEITMIDGWGKYGPSPQLEIIKKAYSDDAGLYVATSTYSEGIHDDINRFAALRFAVNPELNTTDVAREYAREWLGLSGNDEHLMAEIILGLGNQIVRSRDYIYHKDGVSNPKADERLKNLMEIRNRNTALQNNYRYWLLEYRAIFESLSTVEGNISPEDLLKELILVKSEISRLEPEYGMHLKNLERWDKPEYSPLGWPRLFNRIWEKENTINQSASEEKK